MKKCKRDHIIIAEKKSKTSRGGKLYHVWVNNFMFYISRSLQDHFNAKMSSKSAKFEPNGDVRSTYVLSLECMQIILPLPHLQKTHVSLNIK